jgi:RecA-family ATPase
MAEDLKTPNLHYAAALLKKLISPLAPMDPNAADFARLSNPMLEIVLAVYSEGQDKNARQRRLIAEIGARSLAPLMSEVEAADPGLDLATLQTSNWQAFDLADVMTEEIPPVRWLIKPFLPCPGVVVLFGKPKSFKSLIAMDMCFHVAGGYPWLSTDPNGKDGFEVLPSRVVWLDLENGTLTLKRRMKAIASPLGMGGTSGQFQAYSMPDPWPDFSKIENVSAMINRLNALGDIGILVLDHLGQVFGGVDENSPLASQVMGMIRQISEACNLAIILIHHAKKGQGKGGGLLEDQLRGSGAILAGVDAAFLVERDRTDKTQLKLIPVALRGPDAPNVSAQFALSQDANLDLIEARFWRLKWRSNHDRARDAILEALGEGKKNQTQLRNAAHQIETSVSDQTIRDEIADLEGLGEIKFEKGDKGAKIYELAGENEDE